MIPGSTDVARRIRLTLIVAVLAVFGLALLWTYLVDSSDHETSYPYSAMLADARSGRIVSIAQDGTQLEVSLAGEAKPKTVFVASDSINVYAEVCAAAGKEPGPDCPIQFEVVQQSAAGQWLGLLVTAFLPVVLISSFVYFMMRAQTKKQ